MTFWGFDFYHLNYKIYKNKNEHLTLTYLRDITKEQNIQKGEEKFIANNKITNNLKNKLELWHSKYVDVTENDIYEIFVNNDNNTSRQTLNNKELITFKDTDFTRKYINIWAGKDPVDDDVRDMILKARKFKID